MLKTYAIVFLCLTLAAPASAASFDKELESYKKQGDYATTLKKYRALADQGNADAQYEVGVMYHQGLGIRRNYVEAQKWYRKAAEQGHAKAQYSIGVMYHSGAGIPQDHAEQLKWYRKAAEQGHTDAQYNVGVIYHNGVGLRRDYVEAHKWFNIAAAKGDEAAMKTRDYVSGKMSAGDISRAQKLARQWWTAFEKRTSK